MTCCEKAGQSVGVKLSPHMLRHSGVTDALGGGALLFSVQKVAGHSRVATTEKYNHSNLDAQRAAMGKLNVAELLEPAINGLLLPSK
jgi:integrase/recombinase XerD